MTRRCRHSFVAVLTILLAAPLSAQVEFEGPPIDYLSAPTEDPVARLQQKIDASQIELRHDRRRGYLESVLCHLRVPASSQVLVFSKTSFQLKRISPRSPRAVYFGDDVYIGWVLGGDVLELSAVDPKQGAVFYTLDQSRSPRPKFIRQTHNCLSCHGSTLSSGVPGHIVRSVYTAPDGNPILREGTFRTDHTSPIEERWGGWYVTGRHGGQRHLGNLVVRAADHVRELDTDESANVEDLSPWFETGSYLSGHSDIVALMVLEHQAKAQNLITRAGFLTRIALHDAKIMNEMLKRPAEFQSESTKSRIRSAAEPLVEYLLFSEEAELSGRIEGGSGFARDFVARGSRDRRRRSLRDLDFESRLFKYPLSYLIYSRSFDRLPGPVKDRVYRRLWEVLTGKDESEKFRRLSKKDRRNVLEILWDTKRGLPEYWRPADDGDS